MINRFVIMLALLPVFVSFAMSQNSNASRWFDVTYYKLQLNVETSPQFLDGRVTVEGICTADNTVSLTLDLMNTMQIDSVTTNGTQTLFVQQASSFSIALNRTYHRSEKISTEIYYHGTPVATGFGSFVFSSHNGVPWVWTLSEPYGAHDWWPCKDAPGDKADSADIIVTCDSNLVAGSNGILVSETTAGGKKTFHWKERYPIASYLISLAISNYTRFSNWFRYSPNDSMEVRNFVLPEHEAAAKQELPSMVEMLSIYSELYGLYPFIKEKYGVAEFFTNGGMEHQTLTSIGTNPDGTFDEETLAHEMAHQWFGDMITCRTWSDLWLNEGFAVYSVALFREKKYGTDAYWKYIRAQFGQAESASGEVGVPDTSTPRNLFNGALIYAKGAVVLHMLRHVLGDSTFFRAMYEYAQQPSLRYATASTRDFQSVCENVSGKNLDYFFNEWIYGENYPRYSYSWSQRFNTVEITLEQSAGTNPIFFIMPVDIRLSENGWDTTVTVFNDSLKQTFTVNEQRAVTSVAVDPDDWILKGVFPQNNAPPETYSLSQNFPNPFNPKTAITFGIPRQSFVTLSIYDVLGRHVATLVNEEKRAGTYRVDWDASGVATGIYFYRLQVKDSFGGKTFSATKKMAVVR
ncbi:MAG: T9SS type A sorting domain-containing protein [Bacteroidota bacterium]|nr:T9SS type A sorting domain-containing protein [Bacteroidota bacterium]